MECISLCYSASSSELRTGTPSCINYPSASRTSVVDGCEWSELFLAHAQSCISKQIRTLRGDISRHSKTLSLQTPHMIRETKDLHRSHPLFLLQTGKKQKGGKKTEKRQKKIEGVNTQKRKENSKLGEKAKRRARRRRGRRRGSFLLISYPFISACRKCH